MSFSLGNLFFVKNKYICVCCKKRLDKDTAHKYIENIGVCKDCFSSFSISSPASPYKGRGYVKYIISPFEYTGKLRDAFLKYKFDNCYSYAPLFALLMEDYIKSYNIWTDFDFIVPMPLHEKRFKERGYNQSELIAEYIGKITGLPVRTDLIYRIKNTQKQSLVYGNDKLHNVEKAFLCTENLKNKSIIIFDDICTTGLTLSSCSKALHKAGAENICALTFAIHEQKKLPIIEY